MGGCLSSAAEINLGINFARVVAHALERRPESYDMRQPDPLASFLMGFKRCHSIEKRFPQMTSVALYLDCTTAACSNPLRLAVAQAALFLESAVDTDPCSVQRVVAI